MAKHNDHKDPKKDKGNAEPHSKQTQKNGGKHHGGKNGRGGNNGGSRK